FVICSLAAQKNDYSDLLSIYRQTAIPEKIFVHTDKDVYAGGETIWAAVYMVDGQSHQPDSLSKQIHLELRNAAGKVIQQLKLFPFGGHTAGDFILPATIQPGTYQLVAYTNFQRNGPTEAIFRKRLVVLGGLPEAGGVADPIPVSDIAERPGNPELDLRFFPEGGDCIAGLPCRIAIYASQNGQPVEVEGYLRGPNGQAAQFFRTEPVTGVGTLTYQPNNDAVSQLVAGPNKKVFDLPKSLPWGCHLQVSERRDTFYITITSNLEKGVAGTTLVIHSRGVPLLERHFKAQSEKIVLKLAANELPPGVAVATLFRPLGDPIAERLFFVSPRGNNQELRVSTDQATYATRERVELSAVFPNPSFQMDSSLAGRMSVSVLPDFSSTTYNDDDIRTWFLLNSDLDRPVPEAKKLLFGANERLRKQRLEDILLTRAWRRFRWEKLPNMVDLTPEFQLEDGIYLKGRMTNFDQPRVARPGKIFLTRLENGFVEEAMTDKDGNFLFGPYRLFDTVSVDLQGRFRTGKRNRLNPNITLDDNPYAKLTVKQQQVGLVLPAVQAVDLSAPATPDEDPLIGYHNQSLRSLTVARNYDSLIIDLDVVNVSSRKIDPGAKRRRRNWPYTRPGNRIEVNSIKWANLGTSVISVLSTVPGVSVNGRRVLIRGGCCPTFFLDGMPVSVSTIQNFPIQWVEFIDVLKGGVGGISGPQNSSSGAVLVYTKKGGDANAPEPGVLRTQFNGYRSIRQFAVFDYEDPKNRNRPDLRTTIHWNPLLETDLLGRATESFFASDQTGEFLVVVQGLRNNGQPFFGTTQFKVQ
ncbi:MAG: MG2 domain-containing protein, partial [Bacteroidota bacterium]